MKCYFKYILLLLVFLVVGYVLNNKTILNMNVFFITIYLPNTYRDLF